MFVFLFFLFHDMDLRLGLPLFLFHIIINFRVFRLLFATKIQLHVTLATANLCSCLEQVAHDIQLHATLQMQHVYTLLIYMFIHTYQSKCSCTLCAIILVTTM
jgi:hypothetical protein